MKKILFISSLFFVTCILQAQTTVTTTGGTANYVTKFSGAYTIVNSSIYDNGSIGIGTTNPGSKLHINSTTRGSQCIVSDNGSNRHILYTSVADGRAMYYMYNSAGTLTNYFDTYGSSYINGGNVGIGTTSPGSALDVKGTLRLSGSTSGYVGFAPAAAAGSTTYTLPSADGSSGQVLQTNGSAVLSWQTPTTTATAWQLTGNAGTTPGTNFIGTTDAKKLIIKVNNAQSGLIDYNYSYGYDANTFLGFEIGINNTTGWANTATGYHALLYNTTGNTNVAMGMEALTNNTTGYENVAVGVSALYSNISGYGNTAIGKEALYSNTSGLENTAVGYQALYGNTTGYSNIAIGNLTLWVNTTGGGNTAIGDAALYSNTTGNYNTGVGYGALGYTTGDYNSALGYRSLLWNTSGDYNTAVGNDAGYYTSNGTGSNNTFIGYGTIANGDYSNVTAIGNGALATATNYVRVGNASVTQIGGYQDWTNVSDGRFKFNVIENVKGLEFINKLRPVTYQLNTQQLDNFITQNMPDSIKIMHQAGMDFVPSTAKIHSGFIAQEVDSVAKACGFTSSIVCTPANSTDPYALSYAEFVVPLVKAVQELNNKVDSLLALTNTVNKMGINQNSVEQTDLGTENYIQIELFNKNQTVLYQNEPNPANNSTVIRYLISANITSDVYIVFNDLYGNELKKVEINEKGFGKIEVNTENLANGIYTYSMVIDGKSVDTKKMIRSK